jgi:hypothetical protein
LNKKTFQCKLEGFFVSKIAVIAKPIFHRVRQSHLLFYVNQVSVHLGSESPAILPSDKKIGIHPIRFI